MKPLHEKYKNLFKKFKVLICLMIISFNLYSQNSEWAFNTNGTGTNEGKIVRTDNNGNVYIAGNFQGTIYLGSDTLGLTSAGGTDVFFAKYDATGKEIWARSIGGSSDENVYSLCVDASGNIYITGNYNSSPVYFDPGKTSSLSGNGTFVAKYNTNGSIIWKCQLGTITNNVCYSIYNSGTNLYITGIVNGTNIDFNPKGSAMKISSKGNDDIFYAKYDTALNCIFVNDIGSASYYEDGRSICTDNLGNIYVGGYFNGNTVNFDPIGTHTLSTAGGFDIFIAKYTSSGNYIWAKSIGGTSSDFIQGMVVKDSNIYITGYFSSSTVDFDPGAGTHNLTLKGSNDMFFAKYDTACHYRWAYNVGRSGSSTLGYDIAVDNVSNVYITGSVGSDSVNFNPEGSTYLVRSAGGGSTSIFMAKYDNSGIIKWAKSFGNTGNDIGNSIVTDANQNTYITGKFNNTVSFSLGSDAISLKSLGSNDFFIAKYTEQATHITFSGAVGNSVTANWYSGTGTGGRAVFISEDTASIASPVNNTDYTANSIYKSGTQIGSTGWYCVYNNTGNSVTVTGLTEGKTYRVMVCEYDGGSGTEKYRTYSAKSNPANVLIAYAAPTVQASNIQITNLKDVSATINFTKGNGTKRAVFMSLKTLTGLPPVVNKVTYPDTSRFASNAYIGGIGQQWYCVYNDTGSYVNVTNLNPHTIFNVAVIEYKGTPGAEAYNTSIAVNNPLNFETKYSQIIYFGLLASEIYGVADFDPGAISTQSLQISYSSSDTTIATIVGGKLHTVGAGNCTIYANQNGNDTIAAATQVSKTYTVIPAALVIMADTITRTYGELNPVLTWHAVGLQNNDSIGSVTISCSTIDPRAALGNYDINISGAVFVRGLASNYSIVYKKGVMKILESPIKICLVTVDIATGNNLVVWERDNKSNLKGYKVYKQSNEIGVYDSMGTVDITQPGIFVDPTSKNENHAEFYKITTINASSIESFLDQCNYHKTIFLQYNNSVGGVNLSWSPYEVENDTMIFISYVIYKSTDSSNLVVVDTVAANIFNYTDKDPQAQLVRTFYRVAGVKSVPCYPEGQTKAGAGPFSQSVSNLEDNRLKESGINTIYDNSRFDLIICPNPVKNYSAVRYVLPQSSDVKASLVNIIGETVAIIDVGKQIAGNNQFILNTAKLNLSNGIYYLQMTAGKARAFSKISVVR